MKIILHKYLLEIGSAGLRCGRWIVKHNKDKSEKNKKLLQYYAGKTYAYLYVLQMVGLTEFLDPRPIIDYSQYLISFRKGKILCQFLNYPHILIDKKFFNQVLESEQPHQGKGVIRDIRKLCFEIK